MNLGMENERIEFKQTTSELKEGVESIASILNKHGRGKLFFGVNKDGRVTGQDVAESTLRKISQTIGNSIEPRIQPNIEVIQDDEGHYYIRVAFEGKDIPYACKGIYRTRIADEDVVMTTQQLESIMSKRINAKRPWDCQPSERSLSEIDGEALHAYVERGNVRERIPFAFTTEEDVLSRLDLMVNGRLSNAADVLFCPSRSIQLKMGILATHSRTEILDLRQEQGTVFELVDRATVYILNNTRRRFVINEHGPRDEIPEIPAKAVKEALMNAYAHRDWASGGNVQIDIFNDSIEIMSPGWFIEGQNPDEHLSGMSSSSKSRNVLITKTLYRSGDIESYGTGIPRIKGLCSEAGIEIEYAKVPDGTKLIFHRNDVFAGELASNPPAIRQQSRASTSVIIENWSSLDKNEQVVCRYLETRTTARPASISEDLGIKRRTLGDVLNRLIDKGIIVADGESVSRTYTLRRIKENSDSG